MKRYTEEHILIVYNARARVTYKFHILFIDIDTSSSMCIIYNYILYMNKMNVSINIYQSIYVGWLVSFMAYQLL